MIASLAVPATHPEKLAAQKLGIPVLSYPEAVGLLTKTHRTISVCGTHGKTTTTAMIAKTLTENNFDPTVLVGSDLHELGGTNFRIGKSKLLVLESCEYQKAFLNYAPSTIVLTTLDPDHLDYYKTFDAYLDAFKKFCSSLPHDGYLFANIDDENVHAVLKECQENGFPPYNTFTYSLENGNADYYLKEEIVYHKGMSCGKLELAVPGIHNRSNALAAFSVCHMMGVPADNIGSSLGTYNGAARRFELIGTIKNAKHVTQVIDDYGHQPTEIKATLQAARERFGAKAKICVVFQPHQYSRTRFFFNEFVESFSQANTVLIPNIYEARDSQEDKAAISAEKLVAALNKAGTKAVYTLDFEKTVEYIRKNARAFDVVITMGAGDVWKVARNIILI